MGNFVYITHVIWIENIYYPRKTNKVLLFATYIIVFVNQSDKETGGYEHHEGILVTLGAQHTYAPMVRTQ